MEYCLQKGTINLPHFQGQETRYRVWISSTALISPAVSARLFAELSINIVKSLLVGLASDLGRLGEV